MRAAMRPLASKIVGVAVGATYAPAGDPRGAAIDASIAVTFRWVR
jgi:hypothetical protein